MTLSSDSTIDSVVVATDLSETAATAVQWATEIAVDRGARLHLIHALSIGGWATDYVELDPEIRAQTEAILEERLEELADEARGRGLQVTWQIDSGSPSEVVVGAARRMNADLLVVGTRGLRGLDYVLLGSTAARIVQRAPCAVLTVHPHDTGRQRPVRRILVATDFSDEAALAVRAALSFLDGTADDQEITLAHAYHVPYDLGSETGYVPAAVGLQQWQTAQSDVERRLELMAAPLRERGLRVHVLAIEGYPPEVIVEQARRLAIDLVAMGTRGRTGLAHVLLGSTAERVIHRAPCPVLTVRRDDSKASE